MSDQIAYAILFGWCGFSWGQWWAERKANDRESAGTKLLVRMFEGLREKRRFVGPHCQITTSESFECLGEKLTLSLQADGIPAEGEIV